MKTTEHINGRLIYTCPHCGHAREESANPKINPNPFQFLSANCSSCSRPLEIDYDVVEEAHATYHQ